MTFVCARHAYKPFLGVSAVYRRLTSAHRLYSSSPASSSGTASSIVVGGGPAGITILGNLLESPTQSRSLWVDPNFRAGRVNARYREVPSNTSVKLFREFANAVSPFRRIIEETPEPNAASVLRELPQDQGCELSKAADLCLMLTEGLARHQSVHQHHGKLVSATLDKRTRNWTASMDDGQTVTTPHLILCTGSSPISKPLPILERLSSLQLSQLHLDTALKPSLLSETLNPDTPATVAVIGASHSAILVLMNLFKLSTSSHPQLKVKWFTRNQLRYAEHMDGWILRDNTGLKGLAAQWARENLEDEVFSSGQASRVISKIWTEPGREDSVYEAELPGCTHVVQAVGYQRDPIPQLYASQGSEGPARPLMVEYDNTSGRFFEDRKPTATGEGKHVPGLFGAGIAFPERVTDPYGNVEYAVGFFKFMKFARRVVPEWLNRP